MGKNSFPRLLEVRNLHLTMLIVKQVADAIYEMPSNKAPGIDKVPTLVLNDSLLITLPFITSIINASLF